MFSLGKSKINPHEIPTFTCKPTINQSELRVVIYINICWVNMGKPLQSPLNSEVYKANPQSTSITIVVFFLGKPLCDFHEMPHLNLQIHIQSYSNHHFCRVTLHPISIKFWVLLGISTCPFFQWPNFTGGALVPHHAMAVSSACARAGKKLPLEVLQTVREALCCLVAVVTAGVYGQEIPFGCHGVTASKYIEVVLPSFGVLLPSLPHVVACIMSALA